MSFALRGPWIGALAALVSFGPALSSPPPSLAERHAAFDRYAPDATWRLITDLDLDAHFVGDDAVLFRRGPIGASRIILADPKSRREQVLASEADLASNFAAAGAPLAAGTRLRPLDWNPATGTLKLGVADQAWLYDVASGKLRRAPADAPDTGLRSPDGKLEIRARSYNLYVVELSTGREVALTRDGDFDRRYGVNYPLFGDMAAAGSETPDMPIGASWSADSTRIVTYRLSRNDAYVWHGVQQNPPDSRFPREFRFVYPTAGAKDLPLVQPLVIDAAAALATGQPVVTELKVPPLPLLYPGDPPLSWESGRILYQWTKRGYGEVDLYEADPSTGEATVRARESVKPVVTVTSSFIRSAPELGGYLSVSERSGWAQLYFLGKGDDPNGGRPLTHGAWEVGEILRVDSDGRILVVGNGREPGVNPYFHSLYRVTLAGEITNLTTEPLDHRVTVSDDGAWIVDRMSSPTEPTRTLLRDGRDGHVVMELGHADPSALLATGFTPPEPFQTLADDGKTMLYGMIYRPSHFDPSRSYPVIENVYTGPTTHRFAETYAENVASSVNALAEIGAIVVTIDGRGTSQRGQAFRLSAFQNLGEVGIDDHIWVLKAMKAKHPYFDLDRVGVYGGSAGGYDAARFILRCPDFYKVAVAMSGNHDLRLDKAWWPEVSMGLADDATWERNSNIPVAGNLKGHLLLIHGDLDDNVPVTASLRLSQALQTAGKPHELLIVPNARHNAGGLPFARQKLREFFTRWLLGETPSAPLSSKPL